MAHQEETIAQGSRSISATDDKLGRPFKSFHNWFFDTLPLFSADAIDPGNEPTSTIIENFSHSLKSLLNRSCSTLLLFLADIAIIQVLLFLASILHTDQSAAVLLRFGGAEHLDLSTRLLVIPAIYVFAGLLPGYDLTPVERLRRNCLFGALIVIVVIIWNLPDILEFRPRQIDQLIILIFAIILIPIANIYLHRVLRKLKCWGRPIIVVGATSTARELVQKINIFPSVDIRLVGVADDRSTRRDNDIDDVEVISSLAKARSLADGNAEAIIAITGASEERCSELIAETVGMPHVSFILDRFDCQTSGAVIEEIGGTLVLRHHRNLLHFRNRFIKRAADIAAGLIGCVLAAPIILVAALAVKITDPGPAFFSQNRVGLKGRRFKMWKIRTMVVNAEEILQDRLAKNPEMRRQWEQNVKLDDDPRILPIVGRTLRRTSIDELPQFWNLLAGDMSMVGPRPYPDYHLEMFDTKFRHFRQSVRPGLTGLLQISFRSDADLKLQQEEDTYYIRNWSAWLDTYIVFETIRAVLFGRGAK